MSEVIDVGGFEKRLGNLIDEYINKVPCLKISYQLTSADLKAVSKRQLRKLRPIYSKLVVMLIFLILVLFFAFIECHKQVNYFYFFAAVISGILSGVFIGPVLFILILFRKMRKKMSNISEIYVDLSFFEDCVLVRTSSFMSLVEYSSKNNEFIENDYDFIISYMKYPGTEGIQYTFPKKFLDNEEIVKIREYAKKFEERYIVKTKKTK